MQKLKVGVIGIGAISQVFHIPTLKKIKEVELTAICDVQMSKAQFIAKKYSVPKCYSSIDAMINENPKLDAVIIATPTDTHKELAINCLKAGYNVFIEKPISRNYDETNAIVLAAEDNKRILMVGMNNRFRSDVMFQRSFIRSKELTDIFYVKTGWLKTQSSTEKWFLNKEKSGGGVFVDNGIVMLDLGLWMMDFPEPLSVNSVNFFHNTKKVEDSNFTMVKFKNGAVLTIEVSWSFIRKREFFYCNVFGKNGSSSINPLRIYKKFNSDLIDLTPQNIQPPPDITRKSYEYELNYFVGVIKGRNKLVSSAKEALQVMKITDYVYKSAKAGKELFIK